MQITIRTSESGEAGTGLELYVEPTTTVDDVTQWIIDRKKVVKSTTWLQLLFSGQALEPHHTLSHYGIVSGGTIQAVWQRRELLSGDVRVAPDEVAFPTDSEVRGRLRGWQTLAEKGDFDADTHIVDPYAHYALTDSLKKQTIAMSQYNRRFRDSGHLHYRLPYDQQLYLSQELQVNRLVPQRIKDLAINLEGTHETHLTRTLATLCECYRVLIGVIEIFDILRQDQFCNNFFSVLVERTSGTVAELVPINRASLIRFKEALEATTTLVRKQEGASEEARDEFCRECVVDSAGIILDLLDNPGLEVSAQTLEEALSLCRMVVYFLDLGMVSYVGSHTSSSGLVLTKENPICLIFDSGVFFSCSLRPLACLDGFLETSVSVFRLEKHYAPVSATRRDQNKLSILTRIEVLADVWGPVWAENCDKQGIDGNPEVKKYHVSKGCLRRVRASTSSEIPGAVLCHWYSWKQDSRRRFFYRIREQGELTMKVNDKLLIGTDLRVNRNCNYSLRKYEMDYGGLMRPLGPGPSTWRLDGATVAVQVAAPKVMAFQIQGNIKKVPETTIKQHITEKWSFEPERANPGILNSYFGVEISHCTGNARRVPLKSIFLMSSVLRLLERQNPGWSGTPWGEAFLNTLRSESNNAIYQFWSDYKSDRPLVGQLVRTVLDVLDSTGKQDTAFRAAFLCQYSELGIDIDERNNEWTRLLRDSYLMATYAIVGDACLECRRPDHSTSICNNESRFTVLQTEMGLMRGCNLEKRLRVEPLKLTYRRIDNERVPTGTRCFFQPELLFMRMISGGQELTLAKELLGQPDYPSNSTAKVAIRSSQSSFGGMKYPRTRNRTPLLSIRDRVLEEHARSQQTRGVPSPHVLGASTQGPTF